MARKRANDREAQRNIRQRTKQHIENLEKKVKELEGGSRSSRMERLLQINQELETEIERLRSQLSLTSSTPSQRASEVPDDIYVQVKNELDWILESPFSWRNAVPAYILQPNAPISWHLINVNSEAASHNGNLPFHNPIVQYFQPVPTGPIELGKDINPVSRAKVDENGAFPARSSSPSPQAKGAKASYYSDL